MDTFFQHTQANDTQTPKAKKKTGSYAVPEIACIGNVALSHFLSLGMTAYESGVELSFPIESDMGRHVPGGGGIERRTREFPSRTCFELLA